MSVASKVYAMHNRSAPSVLHMSKTPQIHKDRLTLVHFDITAKVY